MVWSLLRLLLAVSCIGTAFAQSPPVVVVNDFNGNGPNGAPGRGLSSMITTDLFNSRFFKKCSGVLTTPEAQDAAKKERDLCRGNPVFDQSTCAQDNTVTPTVSVDGTVTSQPGTVSWTITMRDTATGDVVGRVNGNAPESDWLNISRDIGDRIGRVVCRKGMDYSGSSPPPRQAGPANEPPSLPDPVKEAVDMIRGLKGLFGR
jgi:hypothetical protein